MVSVQFLLASVQFLLVVCIWPGSDFTMMLSWPRFLMVKIMMMILLANQSGMVLHWNDFPSQAIVNLWPIPVDDECVEKPLFFIAFL